MPAPIVLYSVLDWGLGHATRSIPVIKALRESGCRIILAGEGRSAVLLQQEFPELEFEPVKGFQVFYPESNMPLWAIMNFPRMMKALKMERKQTARLVEKYKPDLLISDNRYGFHHPEVKSVFIGHQLRIQAGMITSLVFRFHASLLKNFNLICCPDLEKEPALSGELAHHATVLKKLQPFFIGPLSRLDNVITAAPNRKYDILVLLSGPEPARSKFENKCIEQLHDYPGSVLLLQGKPEISIERQEGSIRILPHVTAESLKGLLASVPVIIARPGYSTLMDLHILGRNAIFIPTPGQTEQEYLAKLQVAKGAAVAEENTMDLKKLVLGFHPVFGLQSSSDLSHLTGKLLA